MNILEEMGQYGHEKVLFVNNKEAGLKAIIAVHNTNLGPALGGCRLWPYASEEEALVDVLRLSRGMSHKNAAAGLHLGGGKAVIIADPKDKTEAMFEAFAEAVNSLGGCYLTSEDVNTNCNDAIIMQRKTKFLCGLPEISGDPSPNTATGVWQGIKAAAKVAFGSDSLKGLKIAIQGVGKVGYVLAKYLHEEGAELILSDFNKERVAALCKEFNATSVPADKVLSTECDILAPCALGGIVNADTVPNFNCKVIAGSANNVIWNEAAGIALKARGIIYAPDFIINAGGVINAASEVEEGFTKEVIKEKTYNIYNTVETILRKSQKTGKPEGVIATEYAESIIYKK